jgi:hypothetical protein
VRMVRCWGANSPMLGRERRGVRYRSSEYRVRRIKRSKHECGLSEKGIKCREVSGENTEKDPKKKYSDGEQSTVESLKRYEARRTNEHKNESKANGYGYGEHIRLG